MNAKKKHYSNAIWLCILVEWLGFFAFPLKAQMKLGTEPSPAHANAILELEASDKGLLFPRVSTSNRLGPLAAAPAGLVVYDSDLNRMMLRAAVPANTIWQSMLLVSDTLSLSSRLSALNNLNYSTGTSDLQYIKRGLSNAAIGIAKFYSWNNSDAANVGTAYSQYLEIGHRSGTQDLQEMNAEISYSISPRQNQGLQNMPLWYQNIGFKLKNKSPFLSFDSDEKMILGKGDQAEKSMFIDASGNTRLGVASIGHRNPDASALLDLNFQGPSDDLGKGLLLPRYTRATLKDNNFYHPARGLLAYEHDFNGVVMNAGTPEARDWRPMLKGDSNATQIYAGTAVIPSLGALITVQNRNVTANSIIILTCQEGDCGNVYLGRRYPGLSFDIACTVTIGYKKFGYLIVN